MPRKEAFSINNREETFAYEYLVDLNPVQAALRCGYSSKTAKEAYRWLKAGDAREKPRLRAHIEQLMAQRAARVGVNADRVVRELARIAFADITQVVDVKNAKVLDSASEDDRAVIASVRVRDGDMFTEREVKMYDKLRALELLGKHMNMFTDQVKIEGAVPVIVDDSGCVTDEIDGADRDKPLIGFTTDE